jgi:hypothetical protein
MAETKKCTNCGRINPPEAQRCDCGYDFVACKVVGGKLSHPTLSGVGCGCLLGFFCLLVCVLIGGKVGVEVELANAGPGPEGACGLWVVGPMFEGLLKGSCLGGMAGVVVAILISHQISRYWPRT